MKNKFKLTLILLIMFVITQLVGLYIVNFYLNPDYTIPYGFDEQEAIEKTPEFYTWSLINLIGSFAIAVLLVFLLMKINAQWFIRSWFFFVVFIALGLTISVFTRILNIEFFYMGIPLIASIIGLILAYIKVFKKSVIAHNLTELLIYPGIAAVFVSILNIWAMIIILLAISIYDIWAVWHSGVMMKMAKFQMNNIGFIGGFMIPYASRKIKEKINLLKLKYKGNQIPMSVLKKQKIKVGLAILGGGDIIFPIIATGVFLKTFNSIPGALCVMFFATLALTLLLIFSDKKKAYPAMPYLTAGIFLGMIIGRLLVL